MVSWILKQIQEGKKQQKRKIKGLLALWPQSSYLDCLDYSVDCEHGACLAHVDAVLLMGVIDVEECLGDVLIKPLVDLGLCPVIPAQVLQPLKVGHGDAASVCKDIRDNQDLVPVQYVVCLRGRWAVGCLCHDFRFDLAGVLACYLVFKRSRYQYRALCFKQLFVAH